MLLFAAVRLSGVPGASRVTGPRRYASHTHITFTYQSPVMHVTGATGLLLPHGGMRNIRTSLARISAAWLCRAAAHRRLLLAAAALGRAAVTITRNPVTVVSLRLGGGGGGLLLSLSFAALVCRCHVLCRCG